MNKANQYFNIFFIVISSSMLFTGCNDNGKAGDVHYPKRSIGNVSVQVTGKRYAMNVNQQNELDTSKGYYLEVDMTIDNNSDQLLKFDSSNFSLTDEQGTNLPFSRNAEMMFSVEKESFYTANINPKSKKEGFLVFEVPARKNYKLYLRNISPSKDAVMIDLPD